MPIRSTPLTTRRRPTSKTVSRWSRSVCSSRSGDIPGVLSQAAATRSVMEQILLLSLAARFGALVATSILRSRLSNAAVRVERAEGALHAERRLADERALALDEARDRLNETL